MTDVRCRRSSVALSISLWHALMIVPIAVFVGSMARAGECMDPCAMSPCCAGCTCPPGATNCCSWAGTCACPGGQVCEPDSNPCTVESCSFEDNCNPHCVSEPIICAPPPCHSGGCVDGECKYTDNCADGDPCTIDACDGQSCLHPPTCPPLPCHSVVCVGGACEYTNTCTTEQPCAYAHCDANGACTIERGCNDENACTTDACIDDACVHTGISCDDNNACTSDWCDLDSGGCHNQPIDCNDNNPCTNDSCDPQMGCVHESDCPPTDACHYYTCEGGPCSGPFQVDCDDNNNCTTDLPCDPEDGCVHEWNCEAPQDLCLDRGCDENGECYEQPVDCDDNNACTADTCISDQGCVHTNLCEDNNPCTYNFCNPNGGCGTQFLCPDLDPCNTICCQNQGSTYDCLTDPDPQSCSINSLREGGDVIVCPGSTVPVTHNLCNPSNCGVYYEVTVLAESPVEGVTVVLVGGSEPIFVAAQSCQFVQADVTATQEVQVPSYFLLVFTAKSSSHGFCGPQTTLTCDGSTPVYIAKPDVDVDSDNTNTDPAAEPQRNEVEENIEDSSDLPGRHVCANRDDDDEDGVLDFNDGFNADGELGTPDDVNDKEDNFVRMKLELPFPIDVSAATVAVTIVGDLRLWTVPGTTPRVLAPIGAGGHLVLPNTYDAQALGFSETIRIVDLWVEGLNAPPNKGADRVEVSVDLDGTGGAAILCTDAVRFTTTEVTVIHLSGLDEQNRVFTTLNVALSQGEPGPIVLRASVEPADAVTSGTTLHWVAKDVDDPASHVHLDPTDHDLDDNDGDGVADNGDGVDNSGALIADHLFTEIDGYPLTDQTLVVVIKDVDADADIIDGPERPVGSFTSITGAARTSINEQGITEVRFHATNDGGDNFRIQCTIQFGQALCGTTFPLAAPPITVCRKLAVRVYAMNNPAGGVYYPFDAGPTAPDRFDDLINAYGSGGNIADRAGYIYLDVADSTSRASLGSNFTKQAPYVLAHSDAFRIRVDGGPGQPIVFQASQFANIAAATAAEVVTAINSQITGATAGAVTLSNGSTKVVIRSNSSLTNSSLRVVDGPGTPAADLGLPVNDTVTRANTAYFPDILDDNNAIQFEEYLHLQTDYHGSNATNAPNPVDMLQIIGVKRQEGFLGATDRPPHSFVAIDEHITNGWSLDEAAAHEPGHSLSDLGNVEFHIVHTATPAPLDCTFENLNAGTTYICPRHLRFLRNSIYRAWFGADVLQTAD